MAFSPLMYSKTGSHDEPLLFVVGCWQAVTNPRRIQTANSSWLPLPARLTGLSKDSVANVSQIVTLDKALLTERAGKLPRAKLELLFSGIDVVLGR